MARRMVEAGVSFVRVSRAWWDSHGQNFETHQEMVPELDHVMATLLDDLGEPALALAAALRGAARYGSPLGAALESVTVPCDCVPPVTVAGLTVSEESEGPGGGGLTVRVAFWFEPPRLAPISSCGRAAWHQCRTCAA